jgi:hypothetical protein
VTALLLAQLTGAGVAPELAARFRNLARRDLCHGTITIELPHSGGKTMVFAREAHADALRVLVPACLRDAELARRREAFTAGPNAQALMAEKRKRYGVL